MERLENFKIQVSILVLAQVVALVLMYLIGMRDIALCLFIFLVINIIMIGWIFLHFSLEKQNRDIDISRILGHDAKDALVFGEVGIITYDEQYNVTWVNDFVEARGIRVVGKKLATWIPEINELFQGEVDHITAKSDDYIYEITRKENAQVIYIRDITMFGNLQEKYQSEAIVVGLIHLDNYMELSQYEDEGRMSNINTKLRQPVVEWAEHYGMMVRRLRSDRFLVILNESIFHQIRADKFSILNEIRSVAEEIDVSITLSMAYARGTIDFDELDDMISSLIELAQSRGGDQVAVKKVGESVKYYGGNSEAQEKRSRVRVRVMAQAIHEAIMDSKRVFIVGHKEMDFDCMGSALCVSRIVSAYGKEAYVVSKSGGIEGQLKEAMNFYEDKLADRHVFLSDSEACRLLRKDDLVIAVDHHNPDHSGAPTLIEKASKVIVIDHHRRSEKFIDNPLLVYVESAASSVSELVTELLQYQSSKANISEAEATLMYLGILIDTNRFKMRTGSRTFEAAAQLKKLGVDPIAAENMLKESFDDFEEKTKILKYALPYQKNMIIASVQENTIFSRTLMSQVADSLLNIKGVEASFVMAKIDDETYGITARSKGVVNVQIIMEKMHGGGHFSASALQRKTKDITALESELKQTIDDYLAQEEISNESNLTK
ncbi:MAG: DHH family phosphoesterase [Erysipelotrichaceae bacterium]